MGLCCCTPKSKKPKREIKIGCFGVDDAGKTTILKMIKGEDPRGVMSTNGFSMIDMEYDDSFTIKVYDIGGHERIREIWTNYYAEVHGIMYVVDISNEDRMEENYDTLRKVELTLNVLLLKLPSPSEPCRQMLPRLTMCLHTVCRETLLKSRRHQSAARFTARETDYKVQLHKGTSKKPFLVVLNKKKPTDMDDFDFSINADLNAVGTQQGQMIFITHVNEYKGEMNHIRRPPPSVSKRPQRASNPLLTQFCMFIDKIIEHYVFLSEGVHSAELALKLRQQEEREERRQRLMRQEQDRVNDEIAELEGRRSVIGNGDIRRGTISSFGSQQPHLSKIEEEATVASGPKPPTPQSLQPSIANTQSPASPESNSPRVSVSRMSSDAFHAPDNVASDDIHLPQPPPKPARNRIVPVNGGLSPPPAPKDVDIFTVGNPEQSTNVRPQSAGREQHLARMRRIQEGLRKRKTEILLQPL